MAPAEPQRRDLQAAPSTARRARGRPSLMSAAAVLERIRQLAGTGHGLFRVHRSHGGLYARARRQFGSWSGAVRAAGVDYAAVLARARRQALETRRKRRKGLRNG